LEARHTLQILHSQILRKTCVKAAVKNTLSAPIRPGISHWRAEGFWRPLGDNKTRDINIKATQIRATKLNSLPKKRLGIPSGIVRGNARHWGKTSRLF
jgi:hypothetical protein